MARLGAIKEMQKKILLVTVLTWTAGLLIGNARSADVYSCVDKAGNRIFQSFSCETDARTIEREIFYEAGRQATRKPTTVQKPGQSALSQTLLQANAHGQFFLIARINGAPVTAIIDTGATTVAINGEDASSIGIDYRRGQRITTQTANGTAGAYLVTLASVQVGDILLTNVPSTVIEGGRSNLPIVLIGMSFLRELDMQRSGNTMVLQRRH